MKSGGERRKLWTRLYVASRVDSLLTILAVLTPERQSTCAGQPDKDNVLRLYAIIPGALTTFTFHWVTHSSLTVFSIDGYSSVRTVNGISRCPQEFIGGAVRDTDVGY